MVLQIHLHCHNLLILHIQAFDWIPLNPSNVTQTRWDFLIARTTDSLKTGIDMIHHT